MQTKPIKLMLVDDNEEDFILTKDLISQITNEKFKVKWNAIDWKRSYKEALKSMIDNSHDIYLVDYRLEHNKGVDLMKEALSKGCLSPIIILTVKEDFKIDIEAMKAGAADYLEKDKIDSYTLERSIRYALERKEAIDAIKANEKKFRNIFEKSKDVIYLSNSNGDILDINDSAVRLFGYSKNELLKLNASQLYWNQEDRKTFEKAIKEKGEVVDFEVTLKTKNNDKIYCLLTTVLEKSKDAGEFIYQGIIHDITNRRRAEQELRTTEKLAVTGRIARTIAHEIRNPLTNVNLSLEQLKGEIPKDDSLDLYFDIITRNTERINQLITELLNSAKPAALQFESYNINNLIEESLSLAQDRINLKKIRVEKKLEPEMKMISVDAEKVKIAFLNIIINAVEAMEPEKGVLQIETYINKNNKCVILISDNGSGISEENLNKLFEPFFSSKPKGMGLGLTSTQNIILNHKGTIEVESEVGKGTTFVIKFGLN